MRYEKRIGDVSIQLEGAPEEIIQVLKYLDKEINLSINGDKIAKVAGGSIHTNIEEPRSGGCLRRKEY